MRSEKEDLDGEGGAAIVSFQLDCCTFVYLSVILVFDELVTEES